MGGGGAGLGGAGWGPSCTNGLLGGGGGGAPGAVVVVPPNGSRICALAPTVPATVKAAKEATTTRAARMRVKPDPPE